MSALRRETVVAAVVAVDPDLETERLIEEKVDASTARERAIWLETAEKKEEAIAETVEEAVVAEVHLSREESESPLVQIQAGSETIPATPARWTITEKIE